MPMLKLPRRLDAATPTTNVQTSKGKENVRVDPSLHNDTGSRGKSRSTSESRKILHLVSPIMQASQEEDSDHLQLLEEIRVIYLDNSKKAFPEVLWRIMILAFQQKENDPTIHRILQFFHLTVTSVGRGNDFNDEDYPSGKPETLSLRILRLCIKYHAESRPIVRLRMVETVNKILQSYEDINEIGESLKEKLIDMLLARIKDKSHYVRAQSAEGLGYLQQGEDDEYKAKEVRQTLSYHLQWDPNSDVRKAAVISVVVDMDNISSYVDKVSEINQQVKLEAYKSMVTKIPFSAFTIAQRERILISSIKSTSAQIKKAGENLLKEWLHKCQGDICTLLRKFDVVENLKLSQIVLRTLFKESDTDTFDNIDKSFIVDKLVPLEILTVENSFLWMFLFERFIKLPYCEEKLLPSLNELCSYINQFLEIPITEETNTAHKHIMLLHIMKIVHFVPLEEGGRREIQKTLQLIAKSKYFQSLHSKVLVQLMHKCHITDKDQSMMGLLQSMLDSRKAVEIAPVSQPIGTDEDEYALRLLVGEIVHKRHMLVQEKDDAVTAKDFLKAHEVQQMINELLEKEAKVRNDLRPYQTDLEENPANTELLREDDEDNFEYPQYAFQLAFATFTHHLRLSKNVSCYAKQFLQTYVEVAIVECEEPAIRKQALEIMTLVGLDSKEDAYLAIVLCIKAALYDVPVVKRQALKCMFDLVEHYGFEVFKDSDNVKTILLETRSQLVDTSFVQDVEFDVASSLRMLLLSYFKSENKNVIEIVVSGVIKLLLGNRLHTPRIISTLILIWVNPVNIASRTFYTIGAWLPIYASTGLTQGMLIGDTLLPTLKKIMDAPKTSSLADASVDKLVALIVTTTDQKNIPRLEDAHKIHESIAFSIVKEMLENDLPTENLLYSKVLKMLNLRNCDESRLIELHHLLSPMLRDSYKAVLTNLKGFSNYLDSLGAKVHTIIYPREESIFSTTRRSSSVTTEGSASETEVQPSEGEVSTVSESEGDNEDTMVNSEEGEDEITVISKSQGGDEDTMISSGESEDEGSMLGPSPN